MNSLKEKQIQWFPGHMFKSLREIKEKLSVVDLVFVLLDARLPYSSMNPEILKLLKDKSTLLLFNKMDLADLNVLKSWQNYYENLGFYTLPIDSQSGKNVQKIVNLSEKIMIDKRQREAKKGLLKRSLKVMIVGIPNVGKSTLINKLSNSKAAKVENRPGVTKAQSWIKLSKDLQLLDTPGVLWPKFDNVVTSYNLAITGAIKDEILPISDVVHYALNFLVKNYQSRLIKRYGLSDLTSIDTILHEIGKKRGALSKGSTIDYERVYKIVLTDIRNNNLGGLSFDRLDEI